MPCVVFEALFILLDSQAIPRRATVWICAFGGDGGWSPKRWKLTKTQLRLVLPEMRNLAVKPQEAGGWGGWVGAGSRKRRKWARGWCPGGLRASNQVLCWGAGGSLQGQHRATCEGKGGKRFLEVSRCPSCLLPSFSWWLICKEQRKEGCIKPEEERTPTICPHDTSSEWRRHCGRGVFPISLGRAGGKSGLTVFFSPESQV